MHWLRKIIATSHHDCRLQDYLTFGPHRIFDWVEFAKPGTLCIYGGSAERVVSIHNGLLAAGELHDLDLVIFSDPNNGPAIKFTFESKLDLGSFRSLKTPESKKLFGYQLKGEDLGGTNTQWSLTIYVDRPPQPTFDDIAHSRILTLKPFHAGFQYSDSGLAEHILETKRLYSAPDCIVYNQCIRVAMREAKGWAVHNSEMDRRVFDSSGALYLNETGHETFIRDLHTIFEGHFPKKNPKAYAKLVYFLYSRLQRHGQDFEKLNSLWDKISQHLLERPLTRNLFPPNTQTIAFQTLAKLADQPEIPTDTMSTHCSDLTSLCEAWASCLTDVGRGHILTDTTSVILTMLSSPQKWKDTKAYVAPLYDTILAIPDLLENTSVSDGILTFLMLNLDSPVKPDRFNPLLGRCLPKISPSMQPNSPLYRLVF